MAKKQIIFEDNSVSIDSEYDAQNLRNSGVKVQHHPGNKFGGCTSFHGTKKQLLDFFSNYYIADWDGAGGMREKFSNQMTDESKLKLSKLTDQQLGRVQGRSIDMLEDLEVLDGYQKNKNPSGFRSDIAAFHPEVLTKGQKRSLHDKLEQMAMWSAQTVIDRRGKKNG